jgi:lysophospholipase L1-like esterase
MVADSLYSQRVMSARTAIRALTVTAGALATTAGLAVADRKVRHWIARNRLVLNETLPVNSAWWRDHAKVKGELLYVAIGDSAAQGIGASAPNRGYVGILADEIRVKTGRSVRVLNLSVSGATVDLAVRDQLPRFMKLKPDVVTVAIGANDIALWDPAVFETGIRAIFAALPPHALVADLPCFHLPHNERKVAVANRVLREVADEHGLTVVPLHATTKRQGLRSVATQFANDFFHPNDRGYKVWADAFLPSLREECTRRLPQATAENQSAQPAAMTNGHVGGAS